ncbi:MAG: hypothetical protein E6Q83_08885 [Thiothrix sp.]|nr:MAG: hypothetical protein E6Q83_08885 [Thiothrix sp.]
MFLKKRLLVLPLGVLIYSGSLFAIDSSYPYGSLAGNEDVTVKIYDLPKSQAEVKAGNTKALPSSKVLVYNAFTSYGSSLDGNYVRGVEVNHVIDFCNVSRKAITVNLVFAVDGPTPDGVQGKVPNILPNKCHMYTWKKTYDYTGIYLFRGFAIPKGEGANILNTDTSKFRVY